MLIRKIKHKFKMIFKSKYDNDIYCNYLHFYNMLFHNQIKDLKQMKKILIKMVEKSYNKTIKVHVIDSKAAPTTNYPYIFRVYSSKSPDMRNPPAMLVPSRDAKRVSTMVNENKPGMLIYNKERHDVELYWNEYFMRNILQLKDIYDEPRDLCKKYKKENKKYKQWDMIIERFNNSTKSYLTMDFKDYHMYIIRILDVKIDIYYSMNKNKLYTKKRKINEDVYDTLKKELRRHK